MIRFKGFDTSGLLRSVATLALAASLAGVMVVDAEAQRRNRNQEEENDGSERTFSARIGEIVLEAQEFQNNDQFQQSITALDRALGMGDINPYERAVSLQLRGRAYFCARG